MSRVAIALAVSAWSGAVGWSADVPAEPAVLPAVQVKDHPPKRFHLTFKLRYVFWGGVDWATFDEIDAGSLLAKAGIREGDRLVEIDGRAVKGMTVATLEGLMDRADTPIGLLLDSGGNGGLHRTTVRYPAHFWHWRLGLPAAAPVVPSK